MLLVTRCHWPLLIALTCISKLSLAAEAAPPDEAPQHLEPTSEQTARSTATGEPDWYGWQTLLPDAAALALFISGAAIDSRETSFQLTEGALACYLLGGPAVHLTHGNIKPMFTSLGLRVGAPFAGALGGTAVALGVILVFPPESNDCHGVECLGSDLAWGTSLGLGLGALGAMALDAAFLAYETPHPTASTDTMHRQPPRKSTANLLLLPSFSPQRLGATLVGYF